MIEISAVEPGDLIFFGTGDPRVRPGIGRAGLGHMGIISDGLQDSKLQMIHQVTKGGSAWGKIELGLSGGTVREPVAPYQASAWEITEPSDPTAMASSKIARIVRCRDDNLRARAAYFAKRWNRFFVPFGGERGGVAAEHEKRFNDAGSLIAEHRSLFKNAGKYRAIKYAARRDGFPCYPTDEGQGPFGQGMFCSMFVVVCYQVAGLEAVVRAADATDTGLRISDKKSTDRSEVQSMAPRAMSVDVTRFHNYTHFLRDTNPYQVSTKAHPGHERRKGKRYEPSIAYWRYDLEPIIETTDWENYVTEGMMVDAKVIYPTGLYESLCADNAGWQDMGNLVGLAETEAKADFNARVREKSTAATYNARRFNRG